VLECSLITENVFGVKMMKKIIISTVSAILATFTVSEAQAISLAKSEKTDQTTIIFKLNGGVDLPFNLSLSGGAEIIPFYSSLVGKNQLFSGNELWSTFVGAEANLGYRFNLFKAETPLGNFNPTLTPFVGYKHFFSHTGTSEGLSLNNLAPATGVANIGGINYGLRFTSDLPLGFNFYAEGGGTSLLNGSYSQGNTENNGNISGSGIFLPVLRAGASWNIFQLASISVGYGLSMLPDIRNKEILKDTSLVPIQSIDLGLRILFISI